MPLQYEALVNVLHDATSFDTKKRTDALAQLTQWETQDMYHASLQVFLY
jgi:hypothetical protein